MWHHFSIRSFQSNRGRRKQILPRRYSIKIPINSHFISLKTSNNMGNSRTAVFLQKATIYALLLVSLVLIASSFPIESHRQLTRRQTSGLNLFNQSDNPLKTLKAGLEVLTKFTVSVIYACIKQIMFGL